MTRVGWVGAIPAGLRRAELVVTAYDGGEPGLFSSADEDVWVVDLAGAERLVRAAIQSDQPVLIRVREDDPEGWWWSALSRGHVDIVATSAPIHEVVARIQGLATRANGWTRACGKLATTAAHDLRSPLQGLKNTLTHLGYDAQITEEQAESYQILGSIADAIELHLDGLYNLGRKVVLERGDVFDLSAAVTAELTRSVFRRVEAEVAPNMVVSGHPGDLRQAVLDMLRVAVQVTPSSRKILLKARREGKDAVLWVEAWVYPIVSPHAAAVMRREGAMNLRPGVKLPLAGLAFAAEVARASGGSLEARASDAEHLLFVIKLPLAPPR